MTEVNRQFVCTNRAELENKFVEMGIEYESVEHPEVFTVEAMMPHVKHVTGAHCKNLFLKDKKKQLYLLSAKHDCEIKLNEVSKQVGAVGGLRLADEKTLFDKLGVKQGCVTAFALINDANLHVNFLLDDDLVNGGHAKVFFHPMDNSASTGISPVDFLRFLHMTGHKPVLIKFR